MRKSSFPAVTAYHPTKGYRRISMKRVMARAMLGAIYAQAADNAAARREVHNG